MKNIPITKRVNSHRSGNFPVNQEVTKKADGTGGPIDNVAKQTTGVAETTYDRLSNIKIKKPTYAEKLGKKLGVKTKKTKKHENWLKSSMYEGAAESMTQILKNQISKIPGKQTKGRTGEEQKEREKFDIDMTNREEVVDYLMTEKGMDPVEADSMYNEGGFTYEDYKKETKSPEGIGKDYKKGYYGK